MNSDDVTVIIATIPPRRQKLLRALESVVCQTHIPFAIKVETDAEHRGAAETRNRALWHVETPYTAFLDDDDLFLPRHLERLTQTAIKENAQVVYSKCLWKRERGHADVTTPSDVYRHGLPFSGTDLLNANYIPVTALVDTDLALQVGGFQYPEGSAFEDWGLWLAMYKAGAKFVHLPEITWICYRDKTENHTAGLGENW